VGLMMLDGMRYAESEVEERSSLIGRLQADIPLNRRLVVALDVPTVSEARALVDRLGDSVKFYKIGYELAFAGGLQLAEELRKEDKWIFLDMKLLDIGNTVEKGVASIAKLDFQFLTIHGLNTKTLRAAIKGRGESRLKLLAVTVLTDLTVDDLMEQPISVAPEELTVRRAQLAFNLGIDGVIASGHEAQAIRRATSDKFIIKTPGIRPEGTVADDQVRVTTPRQAISNGANYLVVGRPIIRAPDPRRVAEQITDDIRVQLTLMGLLS
jgi:orotidine-5'-phosphate decarboxylase